MSIMMKQHHGFGRKDRQHKAHSTWYSLDVSLAHTRVQLECSVIMLFLNRNLMSRQYYGPGV